MSTRSRLYCAAVLVAIAVPSSAQDADRIESLKREAAAAVDARAKFTQQMVDQIFSYGELGFQEYETSKYLVGLLRDNGFEVEEGIAGIPTAWVATWGSGKPVISLGTDIDDIPQASQMPGVACHTPIVTGAPGHGEGHNSGQAVNITAALVVKEIMEREGISGTLQIWPGVAEELVGTKAYYVRAGVFEDVDIVLYSHVGSNLGTGWGITPGTGLISAMFEFRGRSAHAGGAPWRGRSALDAVQLMEMGWNFRREHLRPQHRSHSIVVDGGDQPNVVPPTASSWYYFRERNYPQIIELFETAQEVARGAALMTGTELENIRIIGSAWPGHFNKTVAETIYGNIGRVGLPEWTDDDQTMAKSVQAEVGSEETGLATELGSLRPALREDQRRAGYADDIGDISWNVPTATLSFPSNIPGLPGHNWSNAIAMATPIAHKGATAGAKVHAMTVLDFLLNEQLIDDAWTYFREVQTKELKYTPFIRPEDEPAIERNQAIMERYRPQMTRFYFQPEKYETYLEQLGVEYPTIRRGGECSVQTPAPEN